MASSFPIACFVLFLAFDGNFDKFQSTAIGVVGGFLMGLLFERFLDWSSNRKSKAGKHGE